MSKKYLFSSPHIYTRTLGAYVPLVLAPAEGMEALWAPCQVWVIYLFVVFVVFFVVVFFVFFVFFVFLSFLSFLSFCLFLILTFSLLSFCLFDFLPFCLFTFLPFCLIVTYHPIMFSVPNRNTGKCSGMSVIHTSPHNEVLPRIKKTNN